MTIVTVLRNFILCMINISLFACIKQEHDLSPVCLTTMIDLGVELDTCDYSINSLKNCHLCHFTSKICLRNTFDQVNKNEGGKTLPTH